VLATGSKVAGIDLVVEMDFEIAHISLSFQTDKQEKSLRTVQEVMSRGAAEGLSGRPWEDDQPIVD